MQLVRSIAAMAIALLSSMAAAQDYPARTIKIVVSFTAGGTTDVIARKIAERLTAHWKQAVVIENKPGAGGTLGTDYVVSQPADGYTLLMSSSGPIAISPSLSKKLVTDPFTAIVPVILVADVANVLVSPPELNIRSVDELVKRGKANPGQINYGSTGVGTVAHLAGAQFSYIVGIDTVHVPYKGAGAVTDLMAGRLQFMFATLPSVVGQIKGGKLHPIGQVAAGRAKALPDVPTMKELGYAGMENGSWFGLFAPKGTPQPIVDKLNAQVNEILREKETQEHFERNGAEPAGGSPQDFGRFIRREYETWRPVVQRTGATAD
ncbi:MAG: tripartite tricarboxylate transporter substrate binding protein [Burkholderiales bacterium]|nr:tripartite tricarboxylate transporter substrate binding protein [Burkholderiales bacterium]